MSDDTTPPSARPAERPRAGLLTRFRRADGGATAVEFGLLAMPFFALMFAILEVAMVFWSSQVLETALANAARQIYTGQFQTDPTNNQSGQTSSDLATNFKAKLCANVVALFNCATDVYIDVRNITTYGAASTPPVIVGGAFNTAAFGYQNVGSGQTALVTAAMEYKTVTKMVGGTAGLSDGNRIIMATTIFQTEPYK